MKNIAILYGGPSKEHEVSVASAKNVLENIDRKKFTPIEIYIHKDMRCEINNNFFSLEEMFLYCKTHAIEVIFPVLHGTWGEDGQLQKELERLGFMFVGSGSISSSIAMDKHKTGEVNKKAGVLTPKSIIIRKGETNLKQISFPCIIKPISEGSSVDLFKCNNRNDFEKVNDRIFSNHNEMLLQEVIEGREFTCGVLEKNGALFALPISEVILTKGDMFDYKAKCTQGGCDEITPANIDIETSKRIQGLAIQCHTILGCKSISRTDIIMKESGELVVLETNTLPGLTKVSFIPAQAKAFGIEMQELITLLIESAHR